MRIVAALPVVLALLHTPPGGVVFPSGLPAAAQSAAEAETSLELDRPSRRLIQQGLRNEGFDPGAPDGLFGPRTRGAIRAWQAARGQAATGYLDGAQADLLRAAAAGDGPALPPPAATGAAVPVAAEDGAEPTAEPPVPLFPGDTPEASPPRGDATAGPAPAPERCDEWNTRAFFESATAAEVSACLAAGADVAARRDDDDTPLHLAANFNENPAVIEVLLAAGADLEARDQSLIRATLYNANPGVIAALLAGGAKDPKETETHGGTLLHLAAYNDSLAVIEAFLTPGSVLDRFVTPGADLEARLRGEITPLQWGVIWNKNLAVIEALLAAGADVNAQRSDGYSVIHSAAGNGNPAVLGAVLAAGADVNARTNDGRTVLHQAAAAAQVETLLAAGADVNARTNDGVTVLHQAARNQSPAALEALLAAGADVNAWTNDYGDGVTVLHSAAATNRNPAVIETLLAAGADVTARNDVFRQTALHYAAEFNQEPAVIETLLAANGDVWPVDFLGRTLLHFAARNRNPAVVELLLAAGADVRAQNNNGRSPLHPAAQYGTPAVVGILLRAGADVEEQSNWGSFTPLHMAASNRNPEVAELLLAAGADATARSNFGHTPLHFAAQAGLNVVIERLLAAGAHLETRGREGRTPLHFAANTHSGAAAIPALLTAGADLNMRDEDGNTPLHLAGSYVDQNERHAGDAIAALLDAGADPTVRNAAGETPWDRARDNDALRQSDGYWRLNDARFEEPREDSSRRPPSDLPRGPAAAPPAPRRTGGPTCEIPGYPSPTDVQGLGLSWCGSNVGFQRRAFALQAAGAWCDIDIGSSSTAEQVRARHQEINAACDALDALAAGGGPPCRCPAGYRP